MILITNRIPWFFSKLLKLIITFVSFVTTELCRLLGILNALSRMLQNLCSVIQIFGISQCSKQNVLSFRFLWILNALSRMLQNLCSVMQFFYGAKLCECCFCLNFKANFMNCGKITMSYFIFINMQTNISLSERRHSQNKMCTNSINRLAHWRFQHFAILNKRWHLLLFVYKYIWFKVPCFWTTMESFL